MDQFCPKVFLSFYGLVTTHSCINNALIWRIQMACFEFVEEEGPCWPKHKYAQGCVATPFPRFICHHTSGSGMLLLVV